MVKTISGTGGKKMKKIFVCAVFAVSLAFVAAGCSKQEESNQQAPEQTSSTMQETTKPAAEQAPAATEQAPMATEQAAPATEGQPATENPAGTEEEKPADMK